ncbi:MAG: hypothetical protein NVSMB45_16050 [Ginsengibacter sp.]
MIIMNPLLLHFKYSGILKFAKSKAFCRVLLLIAIVCNSQYVHSQSVPEAPVVYKNWLILGESSTHLDVSSRTIRCDGVNKVELKVISESNIDAVLHCTVTVVNNANGEKVSKDINIPVASFQTLAPSCGSGNPLPDLKIDLPASFNPMDISTTIIF